MAAAAATAAATAAVVVVVAVVFALSRQLSVCSTRARAAASSFCHQKSKRRLLARIFGVKKLHAAAASVRIHIGRPPLMR